MRTLLFVAAFMLTVFADPFDWSNCDTSSLFQPSSVKMNPYPAVSGQNVSVYTLGTDSDTTTGGTWQTQVKKFGIVVQTYSGNLCDLLPNCPCPCPAGQHTSVVTLPVPSFAFSGRYSGEFTAVNEAGDSVVCVDYSFDITSGFVDEEPEDN